MAFLRKFAQIDLIAGVAAAGWAIGAQYAPALASLASPEVAGAFSLLALGRFYAGFKAS